MEGYSHSSVHGSLILNILNIVVLFLVVRALAYKPVRKFLSARADRVAAVEKEAEEKRSAAEALHTQYEAELARAREDADKQATEILARAQDAAHVVQTQAEQDADVLKGRAKAQMDEERDDAMRQLRREVGDIAVDISARVLGREVTKQDNAGLIDAYFDALQNGARGADT